MNTTQALAELRRGRKLVDREAEGAEMAYAPRFRYDRESWVDLATGERYHAKELKAVDRDG